MEKYSLTSVEVPEVTLHVDGDLAIKGWNEPKVLVKSPASEEDILTSQDNNIQVNCSHDCKVYLPVGAKVTIVYAGRDVDVKSIKGGLTIEQIGRDLSLQDTATAVIGAVGRDITAKHIHGDLKIESVGRGAIVRDIDGQFAAETIGAHLHLGDVSEGVSAYVGGDAEISLSPVPWQAYVIKAAGDLHCNLPDDVNAVINVTSGADHIRLQLPRQSGLYQEHNLTFNLGEGGAQVILTAGGKVWLRGSMADWHSSRAFEFDQDAVAGFESIAADIEEQIDTQVRLISQQLESISQQFDNQLEELSVNLGKMGLSPEQKERLHQRLRMAKERATEKTRNTAEHIRQKIARSLESIRYKTVRRSPSQATWEEEKEQFSWQPLDSSHHQQQSETVSDEEQLLVLKMLEEGKITVEEAEKLLQALESAT